MPLNINLRLSNNKYAAAFILAFMYFFLKSYTHFLKRATRRVK